MHVFCVVHFGVSKVLYETCVISFSCREALCAGGYGVSLDFSHAFDCVSAKLVREVLIQILPVHHQPWGSLLRAQWQSLRKLFDYGGNVAARPILGEVGIPQGDPASPVALMGLLLAGKIHVESTMGNEVEFQCI